MRFIKAIAQQGHRVWYAALEIRPSDLALPQEVRTWPHGFPDASLPHSFLDAEKIDLVHAGPIPTVAALAVSQRSIPSIVMAWGSDILADAATDLRARARAIKALRAADLLFADCRTVVAELERWGERLSVPTIVFPWGVELQNFPPHMPAAALDLRRKLGWDNHVVLISTRAWASGYGIELLLEGFREAVNSAPELRLILAGNGPLRSGLLERIRASGLADVIHCPGYIAEPEIPNWLWAADLYISSSLCDGSSVSLLEAMACARPAIVHNAHGNLEWVENNINGWLCNFQNPSEVCATILKAMHAHDRWSTIGHENRRSVAARADWSRNAPLISEGYRRAIEHFRSRSQ